MPLHLVGHGPAQTEPGVSAAEWRLGVDAAAAIAPLRSSGVLPVSAAWFVSPEPKAIQTADLLGPDSYEVVDELREQERTSAWLDDFEDRVVESLSEPDLPAILGWEPAVATRRRVVDAVRAITVRAMLRGHDDVVLVGHRTAWTLLVAALTDSTPDVAAWRTMLSPDHCALDGAEVTSPWGAWRAHDV